jgi:hypothetical protein
MKGNPMGSSTDRLDRFVRWFFNSSPVDTMIVPVASAQPASPFEQPGWVRHSAFGGAVIGALILLVVFYSVVAGAVEHAAIRRTQAAEQANAALPYHAVRGRAIVVARAGS